VHNQLLYHRIEVIKGYRLSSYSHRVSKRTVFHSAKKRSVISLILHVLLMTWRAPRHTTNDTVRSITGCLPVSEKVKLFRLWFFGHLARSAPEEDHDHVIAAALRPPPDWRRPPGRPRSTWLRVIDEDVRPRTLGSTRLGGRQRKGILCIKSSVQQRSARSSPPRRKTQVIRN